MRRKHYDDEHLAFGEAFRAFIDKEIVPHYLEWERAGIAPRELFTAAGRNGFLGMAIPEEYGGGGVDDFRFNQILGEQIAAAGVGGAGLGITLHNDICLPYFLSYCTDEQKQRWLPGIASGELITAVAMTEPGAGSDLAGIRTSARRDGDHYVVNGSQDVHHQRHQRRPGDHRGADRRRSRHTRHVAARPRARACPASSAAATSTSSACTPRTPPSCRSPTSGCRSRTCSARRARASPS